MAYDRLSLLGLPKELIVNICEHLFTLESSPNHQRRRRIREQVVQKGHDRAVEVGVI